MIWTAIVGILLGLLLWHGEQPEVREAKAKARRRKAGKKPRKRKPRRTITHYDGLTDLEEVVLIDDFEEEVLEE